VSAEAEKHVQQAAEAFRAGDVKGGLAHLEQAGDLSECPWCQRRAASIIAAARSGNTSAKDLAEAADELAELMPLADRFFDRYSARSTLKRITEEYPTPLTQAPRKRQRGRPAGAARAKPRKNADALMQLDSRFRNLPPEMYLAKLQEALGLPKGQYGESVYDKLENENFHTLNAAMVHLGYTTWPGIKTAGLTSNFGPALAPSGLKERPLSGLPGRRPTGYEDVPDAARLWRELSRLEQTGGDPKDIKNVKRELRIRAFTDKVPEGYEYTGDGDPQDALDAKVFAAIRRNANKNPQGLALGDEVAKQFGESEAFWESTNRLLDKGLIYEPVLGAFTLTASSSGEGLAPTTASERETFPIIKSIRENRPSVRRFVKSLGDDDEPT